MTVRVVAGEYGGRRLETPPGSRTRPTRAAVREAWFSALGDRVVGARVCDLFAGSGALGIEALSRGAASVHFVDGDPRACRVVRGNLRRLGAMKRARVIRADVQAFVGRLGAKPEPPYDLVLADPPYESGAAERLVRRFVAAPFAELLCVEHARGTIEEPDPAWRRRYGDSVVSFFGTGTKGVESGS